MLTGKDAAEATQRINAGTWKMIEEVVRERDALRAERDELRSWKAGSLEAARESDRLLAVAERTIATQYERVDALRARVAELEAGLRSITAADPSETQLEAYVHWVHDTVRGLLQSAGAANTEVSK